MTVYTACQQILSLTLDFSIFSALHRLLHRKTHLHGQKLHCDCAHTQMHTSHRSKDGPWLTCVCCSNIMFLYITIVLHITTIIIVPFVTAWKGEDWRFKAKKSSKKNQRLKNERCAKGQRFPSTPVHDLIVFCSIETFQGMKICYMNRGTHKERKEIKREKRVI